ncbi:MAG: HAD-IC family P-type ATPase [Chloroflexi bacterium]|nr:HAD-IC family P-type ATPase [Chloroflexota bacterium]
MLTQATHVEERIGVGISGVVNGKDYRLSKLDEGAGMAIEMQEAGKRIAVFRFEDQMKPESAAIVQGLKRRGLELYIFTGDRAEAAQKVATALGGDVTVKAECTPADKKAGIEELKRQGKTVAMVGDGINDAPALAYADVGLVFSNEEQTAASEAADIVFLGGEFSLVNDALVIAQRTIRIALQSIRWGIGISVAAMIAGALGFIPPIIGAGLQEAIDVAVIINALRASRS